MRKALALSLLTLALTACGRGGGTMKGVASPSPLIGTWQIVGNALPPAGNLPRFTRLTFKANGSLSAVYVPAGALSPFIGEMSLIRRERDSYSLVGRSTLRIVEGSRTLDYVYSIRDRQLFLVPPGGGDAILYGRV